MKYGDNIFHVDVRATDYDNFYYNMVAEVNKSVVMLLGSEIDNRLMTDSAMKFRNNVFAGGLAPHHGPGEFGVMGNKNHVTGDIEYILADQMQGICATVSRNMAEEIVERAIYYCPKDTGYLASSFRIEDQGNGKCIIFNDCPYAWYVEEFTWKEHDPPTQAKFLTTAIYEIEKKYGLWA